MKSHILFVCGQNKWRSPTAVHAFRRDERLEARSAGVSKKSRHQISRADIEWADLILVMEPEYRTWIVDRFEGMRLPPMASLDIPDEFARLDEELIELIRSGTEPHLPRLATNHPMRELG
jgi:predicted protein tyrosine phosphatase